MNLVEKMGLGAVVSTILIIGTVVVLAFAGWIGNIVKLTKCDFEAPYKSEVIRSIGIVIPPVGIITGYMDIQDGESEVK